MKLKTALNLTLLMFSIQLFFSDQVSAQEVQAEPPSPAKQSKNASIDSKEQAIKHSFLALGKKLKAVIVNESGDVAWKFPMGASDGWVLENGNVLLALYPNKEFPKGGVVEVDRKTKKVLWQYKGQQKEVSTVQKIGDDRYLVAELGGFPRAVEINRKGEVLRETPFKCQKKRVHLQTRMVRMLPSGNFLAPHLLDFAVKEYEPGTGKLINSIATDDRGRERKEKDWPFTAIRLKNGNTVVGCTIGNRVVEFDKDGKIVWSVNNDDLGEKLISDACGVQRLPNGNTVITSYRTKGDQVKLIEVTPEKEVVWKFNGFDSGIHHFQILTTNGQKVSPVQK